MWYTDGGNDPARASSDALYAYNSLQAATLRLEEMRQEGADEHAIEGQVSVVNERARKVNECYARMKELDRVFGHGQQVHTAHSWRDR